MNILYWMILLCGAITISFILFHTAKTLINHWFVTITSLVSLIGVFFTLKDISTRFQKFLYKSKVILRNRQIAWSLDGTYQGEQITSFTFTMLKDFLKGLGENNTVLTEDSTNITLTMDGVIIQCSFSEDINEDIYSESDNKGSIALFIPEYHAPYVESNVLLETRVIPILNEVKQKIGECEESFTFDVFFKEYHPYLGLYLKGSKNNKNTLFNCSFIEAPSTKGINDQSLVTVSLKKLSMNTKTIYSLNRLIQKHLFLSGG